MPAPLERAGLGVMARKAKLTSALRSKARKRQSEMSPGDMVAWRERHGLDPKAAGAALGVGWRTIYHYEAGARAIPPTVALLCKAYDGGFRG